MFDGSRPWSIYPVLLLLVLLLLIGSASVVAADEPLPPWPCLSIVQPTLTSEIPSDNAINDQDSINCFGWQEFIALNWLAAGPGRAAPVGPDRFGEPGNLAPVVWETYKNIHSLMLKNGAEPAPWGSPPKLPDACADFEGRGFRSVARLSKFGVKFDAPGDTEEAFPFGNPNWLADKDGNLVYFEILVNEDEYNYIRDNGFYNADIQLERARSGTHINLPRGVAGGATGSIELKAAWLRVPDPRNPKWERYKLTKILVEDTVNNTCEPMIGALVGLHIIHKTTSNSQWIWATFEHRDNAPDLDRVQAGKVDREYTFYSTECRSSPVPADCRHQSAGDCEPWAKGDPKGDIKTCAPNVPPAYCYDPANAEQCPPYPVQVARRLAIANHNDNLVQDLNANVHAMIRAANPDSVWAHYDLVGVLWSGAPVDENLPGTAPSRTPLSIAGMRPNTVATPLANTTMETYIQEFACVDCHHNAEIAKADDENNFASDYSFVFQSAQSPPAAKKSH